MYLILSYNLRDFALHLLKNQGNKEIKIPIDEGFKFAPNLRIEFEKKKIAKKVYDSALIVREALVFARLIGEKEAEILDYYLFE